MKGINYETKKGLIMKQRRAYEGKGRVELGKMRRLKSDDQG